MKTIKNKDLYDWKESAMKVMSDLDLQGVAKALGMGLGTPIAPNVLPKILELKQANKELVEMLGKAKWELEQFKDSFGQSSLFINEIGQLLLKHNKQ